MWQNWLKPGWCSGLLVLLLAMPASAQWQMAPFGRQMRPETALINDQLPPTEYWLGIQCMPVPPMLRSHLKLPEKQGLLVDSVAEDSPAAKAGLVAYDVVLSAAGKPLANPIDLVQAVEEAKESKLTLDVIREGERKTVEVTPAKRPEGLAPMTRLPGESDWNTIRKWMAEQGHNLGATDAADPLHFRLFRPGAILPKQPLKPMPGNMNIAVTKEGDQPAKITVKRGDEKWDLTEKDIDKLPADVRPFVEQLLGKGGFSVADVERAIGNALPAPKTSGEASPENPAGESFETRMERRMAELDKRIEEMWKSLDASIEKHFPSKTETAAPPDGK